MSKLKFLFIFTVVFFCANFFVFPIAKAEEAKPDLIITAVDYTVTPVINGYSSYDEIRFTVSLKNIGQADCGDFSISVTSPKTGDYINGYSANPTFSYIFLTLDPVIMKAGQEYTTGNTAAYYAKRKYNDLNTKFTFVVDSKNEISESNENNNTFEKAVVITDPKPDLTIKDIYYYPNNPVKGQKFNGEIRVKIDNIGNQAVQVVPGGCLYTNALKIQSATPIIEGLQGSDLSNRYSVICGPTTSGETEIIYGYKDAIFNSDVILSSIIDNANTIGEANENNNTFEKTVTISASSAAEEAKPDLVVTEVGIKYFGEGNPQGNSGNYYYATVKNIGGNFTFTANTDSGILGINFYGSAGWLGASNESVYYTKKQYIAGDKITSDQEIELVGPSTNQASAGTYTLKALVNPMPQYIAEGNYQNNTLEKTVTIGGTAKPDLTVTSIKFESPNNLKGEDGTLSVTVKNLGSDLSNGSGLLNWYNNFPAQNFVFNSATPSILSFKTDRDVPTAAKPLKTNETITFSWLGNFNTSGNLYLHFTVDNGNELDELNEKNNTLSTVIQIKENSQDTTEVVKDEQIVEIDYKAKLLNKDEFSTILAELKELRNIVKEQASKIKYFEKLAKNMEKLSAKMESAINNFITYGVDENTKKLGEGERAAVMYSYKSAFSKLPETEAELADAIKIANGRWPSITNDEAEKKAKEQFQKIYQRIADMNNANDNAAVTVMAYGLRQRAENRNLGSEKNGIKIFKNIYGRVPSSTEDWNIMQAITYSGSTRGTDSDGDLLTDEREAELGTDPKKKDTDGDGYIDGIEVANGFDPLKK